VNILYITGVLNRGGAEIMLLNLTKNLTSHYSKHILGNYQNEATMIGILTDEFKAADGSIHYIRTQWIQGVFIYY
tara:strand:+ start:30 stop:254 length:225 start_codon:yes stop_codon:yes gene_type:complete